MKLAVSSRKIHKWVFLFIGVQALLWVISGFYMVVVNLDFIHGDHLVKNLEEPLRLTDVDRDIVSTGQLLARYGAIDAITLKAVLGRPHYILKKRHGETLIDAETGSQRSPIDENMARTIAQYHYTGTAPIINATLITENPPSELQTRPLPLWRIDFADRFNTSFYVSPDTATLITRRHDFWRIFDFFWMLHIMDYDERSDVNNNLLRIVSMTSLAGVLAGLVLLFYSFGNRKTN
jgi:hypothetical protein